MIKESKDQREAQNPWQPGLHHTHTLSLSPSNIHRNRFTGETAPMPCHIFNNPAPTTTTSSMRIEMGPAEQTTIRLDCLPSMAVKKGKISTIRLWGWLAPCGPLNVPFFLPSVHRPLSLQERHRVASWP